jgi:tRNA nucleotidyltransferase (CCA-adding enzyme)
MRRAIAPGQIPDEVVGLCRTLIEAGHEAHLVGGGVRDLLLGRQVHDWDVATSARPEEVQALFPRTLPIGIEHGTVVVVLPGADPVEVTTYRGDGAYSDGRRPDSVTFVRTLREDLSRRDLTINAIALAPLEARVVDPLDGQADLGRRLIRAVGDPVARFTEDGLRPMRAVRFAATLGFNIEERTLAAMARCIDSFRKVSAERIRDELLKLLAAQEASRGLTLMARSGLMVEVLPELPLGALERAVVACDATERGPLVRLAGLLSFASAGSDVDATCRRLKLSNQERRGVCHLVTVRPLLDEPPQDPAAQRRILSRVGPAALEDLLALQAGLASTSADRDRQSQAELAAQLRAIVARGDPLQVADLDISGHDVIAHLGAPGPAVGQLLAKMLERVLDDPTLNTRAALLEILDAERSSD